MIYVPLMLFCVVFFELFRSLRIAADAMAIMARSQEAMRVLGSAKLSDDEKEVFVRRASGQIFISTLRFAAKFALIALTLVALFEATVMLVPYLDKPLLESLVSPLVIVMLTVATTAYAWVRGTVAARLAGARVVGTRSDIVAPIADPDEPREGPARP
jgi:hypothetical protein